MNFETICAPATAPINSTLAIIRMSGPESLRTASKIFSNYNNLKHRLSLYGTINGKNKIIDDVVLTYFKAPNSFTGEDCIEISCHGNPLIVQKIIKLLIKNNIRMAEPGEFSKRAFLNGKIDLTGAEAINQIINARSEWEIEAALKQMHGALRDIINKIRGKIILLKADIECNIDFSGEDVEFISYAKAWEEIKFIKEAVSELYQRCKLGEKISHGINIAIVGRPNVGKSSLLNLLLNEERAIVTDIPGTTRDLIKETIQFNGIHVNLIDTAGIRDAGCQIEKIGIEKSKKEIETAPIIILLIDAVEGITQEDKEILKNINEKKVIVLGNKIDLAQKKEVSGLEKDLGKKIIAFSTITSEGLDKLEKRICNFISKEFVQFDSSFIADLRILNLLEKSLTNIKTINMLLQHNEPPEIIAFELQLLIDTISEITGEVSADEVLNSIFNRFCIGK